MGFYERFGKRLIDLAVSGAGLLVAWPVLAVIAALVKLDSPGPVFYRGTRVGRHGEHFRIFKFRTMVVDAERRGPLNVGDTDERVTRAGRWLRTTKLDELPQLISVFKGDMSLVGPRPDVPQYAALYSPEDRELILSLPPGVTDWASIVNFDQYVDFAMADDPDGMFKAHIRPLKVELQRFYAQRRGAVTDLRILAWTVRRMILRSRALPRDVEPHLAIAAGRARNTAGAGAGPGGLSADHS
jgi:lipopolysaccharide/colanic/teichoic acid biosynthesis glycosyltransferase